MKRCLYKLNFFAGPLCMLGIAAVAIYNWWLWQQDRKLLAKLEEPESLLPINEWPELPTVSVLVAAWNEAGIIDRHIQSFLDQRYPNKEMILCAGGRDGTYELAKKFASEQVIVLEQQPGEGKQRALARGLPKATGSIVFLTDADCLLDNESFERTLFLVASGQEQVCTGGSRPYPELLSNRLVVVQAASDHYIYNNKDAPDYLPGLLGRNCAIERRLLERSRGLDEFAPTGTDYVLAKVLMQKGSRIRQERTSQIMTDYPRTPCAYINQQRRWIRNVALYGSQYSASAETRSALLLSIVGLLMLTLPFLSLFLGSVVFAIWFTALTHGYASRLRYLSFFQNSTGFRVDFRQYWYLFLSLWLDFIGWAMPLLDLIVPRRRSSW